MTVRVRIAPSPTGNLHIGTSRTALFNYLFAKSNNGSMIVRIEDTDLNRSTDESLKNIIDGLSWLGIDWDEGPEKGGSYSPYFQSKKLSRYKEALEELKNKGLVYEVYATDDEIAEKIEKFKATKQYTAEKAENMISNFKKNPAYKFKAEKKDIVINDLIKGEVKFEAKTVEDIVLFKSDGMPTYNFAVVVDDIDMEISHVIRGDDHLSNTTKQILIYEALDKPLPKFAHLGMILAKDDETGDVSKMSKRHGAVSISDYQKLGYLPEAIFNYISFLGWSSGDEKELFTKDELIKEFNIDRVSKSASIFDIEKLNWYNQNYLRNLPYEELLTLSKPYFEIKKYDLSIFSKEIIETILNASKNRSSTLSEMPENVDFLFDDNIDLSSDEKQAILQSESTNSVFEFILNYIDSDLEAWDLSELKKLLKKTGKKLKVKPRDVMMPVRVLFTGKLQGIDLNIVLLLIGKEKVIEKINGFLKN